MFLVPMPTYFYYIREKSIITSEIESEKLFHFKRILKGFYDYIEKKSIYSPSVDYVEYREQQLVIRQMTRQQFSSFRIYQALRKCDIRSYKTKNLKYKTTKERIANLDQYLPSMVGYVYKIIFNMLWQMKNKLCVIFKCNESA